MDDNTPPRIYVLYTGGTIGMAGSPLTPLPLKQFADLVASQPGFTDTTLTVQLDDDKDTVIEYTLDAFAEPLDSSSMTPADWVSIAERLLVNYGSYDGLVVLHGTDTMAFTASALSFLLDGQTKPVIVTGAQIPLQQTRNDALRNMVSSMVVAATCDIPESTLLFDTVLLRGNRSEKVNASEFPAFRSPNFEPLGLNGISIEIDQELVLKHPPPDRSLDVAANRDRRQKELATWSQRYRDFSIVAITLFPGIEASTVSAVLEHTEPPVGGVVIEAFGSGNAPADTPLIDALETAHDEHGVVLVDVTQVLAGSVDLDAYASASGLKAAGAVSGFDMTPEAALTKLVFLTGLGLSQDQIEHQMATDLRGELSEAVRDRVLAKWKLFSTTRGPAKKRPLYPDSRKGPSTSRQYADD